MARFVLLLAFASLIFVTVPASAMPGLQAGVKGGLNIANQTSDNSDMELADSRSGMALGAWVRVPATPMVSIQPEALFSMKGDREEDAGVTGTVKIDYLEVPVLAKLSLAKASPAKPSLFVGPSMGFNLSAKSEVDGAGAPMDGETDIKDYTKSVDFGVVFGGGLEYNNFGLDLRYTLGLSNINDTGSDAEVKNNVISIMGSYGFL